MSSEAIVALATTGVVMLFGFIAWLTRMSWVISRIYTLVRGRLVAHDRQFVQHSTEIRGLKRRVETLERGHPGGAGAST
jgi:FtsH-binding integral membrane protein